jgi:recombinational DNA repair protein RecR
VLWYHCPDSQSPDGAIEPVGECNVCSDSRRDYASLDVVEEGAFRLANWMVTAPNWRGSFFERKKECESYQGSG